MTWWLYNNSRLNGEKAALAQLEGNVDWLSAGKWIAKSDLAMCVDFRISHGSAEYAFQMVYPGVFPDSPPMIFTDNKSRISRHQYGAEGELCLEYRPDNWHSDVTGADMVASCQRLLAEEHPEPGKVVHARSAHIASVGRDLRNKFSRFLLTNSDISALNTLSECSPIPIVLRSRSAALSFVSSIKFIGTEEAPIWSSDLILPEGGLVETGIVVRVPGKINFSHKTLNDLVRYLEQLNLTDVASSINDGDNDIHLLVGNELNWEFLWVYGKANDRKSMNFATVLIPSDKRRLPNGFDSLAEKKVGIVGCGSLGSKVAASLCRSGVRRFLLIDEDIFFPGNVTRNELDLTEIGAHKSNALRDRLQKIAPSTNAISLRLSLGGQESAESMAGALEALGNCDLLIDATADPIAFNMIASIATRKKKPMVWGEVFAGGIGGFIARARPEIDPVPLSARAQIEVWFEDQGVEWQKSNSTRSYEGLGDDGKPLIADDAEVGVISSHLARFATDILVRPDSGIFPTSAYVIGFSSEWLFKQPFDTRPIDLWPEGYWGEISDNLDPKELINILIEHLPQEGGADVIGSSK